MKNYSLHSELIISGLFFLIGAIVTFCELSPVISAKKWFCAHYLSCFWEYQESGVRKLALFLKCVSNSIWEFGEQSEGNQYETKMNLGLSHPGISF